MIPKSIRTQTPAIQSDVRRAFLMRERRVFERGNKQIYAIVGANPEMGVVSEVWFGEHETSSEFRDVLVHVLDLIRSENLRYWLIDLRFRLPDFHRERDWLVDHLIPAAIEAGLVRAAAVLSETSPTKEGEDLSNTLFSMLAGAGAGYFRGFTDIDFAKRWLLEGVAP